MSNKALLKYQRAWLSMPTTKQIIRLFGTHNKILLLENGGAVSADDLIKPNPEAVKVIRKVKGIEDYLSCQLFESQDCQKEKERSGFDQQEPRNTNTNFLPTLFGSVEMRKEVRKPRSG